MTKEIILTGDRPTGKLHIGHYIGSLKNRVMLQNTGKYDSYIMIADTQALTDNARNPEKDPQLPDRKLPLELPGCWLGSGKVNHLCPVPNPGPV